MLQRQAGRPVFTDTDRAVLAGLLHRLPNNLSAHVKQLEIHRRDQLGGTLYEYRHAT